MTTLGRNDKCSCGSGKKYKQCCMLKLATSRDAVTFELQTAIKHYQAGQFSDAENVCRKILQITPNHPEVLYLLGVMAYDAKAYGEAFIHINQANMIMPSNPFYLNLLGSVLCEQDRLDEAVTAQRKAISLKPDFAEAHNNLGNSKKKQGKLNEAIACYQKATAILPNYANAHYNLGIVLQNQGDFNAALNSYDKAISCNLNVPDIYAHCGESLLKLNRLEEALANFNKTFALKPDYNYLLSQIILLRMQLCQWDDYYDMKAKLIDLVQSDRRAELPFVVVTFTDLLTLHRKAAQIYVEDNLPANIDQNPFPALREKGKIHIGYFSSDFGNHPVTHLMIGLLESHDKNNFEITAFSFGQDGKDKWKERVVSACDHFIDVQSKSDKEVALLARSMGIDIAVDLNGYTNNSRPFIFAERAAPIQVSYIGYLGTLGANYIDYLIADRTIIPDNKKEFYTEKIIYIPNYQCNVNNEEFSAKIFKRSDFSLPDNGIVFCSFNNNYKITPDVFSSWMKILKRVEGSVLWLFVRNNSAISNLKMEAEKQGVDSSRIVFAGVLPRDEHLSRHCLADIFLDTYPCNAGATASDALRMGVPLLTRSGETFASRIAASLLNALDLPELITTTKEEYEELAVDLATDPKKLASINRKLAKNQINASLFDEKLNTKHMEAAYTEAYERYCAGLPPDHIYIS